MMTHGIDNPILAFAITAVSIAMGLGMLLASYRLVRGPSLPDRVISLDLIGSIAIGIIALYSIASGSREMLSVAVVMALILFLGTAAFATYLHRRARQ